MIIVEGPDGSGKTTLAKKIEREFGQEYRRYDGLSSSKGPDGLGIVRWWNEQLLEPHQDGVYDRCFYISEALYQLATVGRQLLVDGRTMHRGAHMVQIRMPLIIFCLPPWETSKHVIGAQAETLEGLNIEAAEKVHWGYWNMMTYWEMVLGTSRVAHYDFTGDSDSLIINRVKMYLKEGGN